MTIVAMDPTTERPITIPDDLRASAERRVKDFPFIQKTLSPHP